MKIDVALAGISRLAVDTAPFIYFAEKDLWMFAYEILLGIEYLHSRSIIHRDIKTLNIFISKKNQSLKIGDLGVSKIVSSMAAL